VWARTARGARLPQHPFGGVDYHKADAGNGPPGFHTRTVAPFKPKYRLQIHSPDNPKKIEEVQRVMGRTASVTADGTNGKTGKYR